MLVAIPLGFLFLAKTAKKKSLRSSILRPWRGIKHCEAKKDFKD